MADPVPATPDADPIVTPWYLDKALYAKLLFPIISLALAWLNSKLPVPLNADQVSLMIGGLAVALVTFIVSHKAKTTILQKAQIAADSAVAAAKGEDPAVGLAAEPK